MMGNANLRSSSSLARRVGVLRSLTQCDETASPAPGFLFEFLARTGTSDLATHPGPRVSPVAGGGSSRNAEILGRPFAASSHERTQLDQPALDRLTLVPPHERVIALE